MLPGHWILSESEMYLILCITKVSSKIILAHVVFYKLVLGQLIVSSINQLIFLPNLIIVNSASKLINHRK